MGGIYVDFSVVNQLNSPALNSNTFANRPSAGQAGRLFVSTDTFEIYRDNGTTWDLIGGPGSSTITGTGTAGNFPIFTSSQAIGNSEMYYTEGGNFNNINFGYTGPGGKYNTTELNIFSNNESRILLQFDNNKYAQLSNDFGNVYLGANNLGIHGANNVFYYNGSSTTDRYLSFQTEGLDRLTIEQNGDIQLNKYTTDGFLRTSGANGTLSIDTNTYVTSNIYTADGTLAAARTVNLNNHNLRFEGAANTARVRISANNNVPRIFSFATADSARWAFRVDGNETGSNAGANFELRRYNDAGSYVSSPIIVNRASGHVGIGGGLQQLETFNVTGSSLFSHSYTQGNDFNRKGVFAFLNTTTNSGAGFTNGYNYNAITGLHWDNFSANTTIPNGVTIGGTYSGAQVGFDTINTTVTLAQGSGGGLRTFSGSISQIALAAPTTGGVVTHASGFQALAPYYIGANLPTITNYFGVAINDSTEYSSVAITNRWGIYQNGATDRNYLNGNTLIGSNVDNGNKLQVTGQATISGNVGIGTSSPAYKLHVVTDAVSGRQNMSNISRTTGNWVRFTNPEYSIVASMGLILRVFPDSDSRQGAGIIATGGNNNGSTDLDLFVTNSPDGLGGTSYSALKILSNGNVGIGTTSPASRLSVGGDGFADRAITAIGNAASYAVTIRQDGTNGSGLQVFHNTTSWGTGVPFTVDTSNATFMRITSGGNVLIGTTTDAGQKLQVNGSSYLKDDVGIGTTSIFYATANRKVVEINGSSSSFLAFKTGDTPKSYLFQNGSDFIITNLAAAGGYLALENNGAERIRIKPGGQTRFVPLAADPGGAEAGDVYYNSGTNKLRLYDGTNWVDLN